MRIFSSILLLLALGLTQLTFGQVLPGSSCQTAIPIQCGSSYAVNTAGVLNDNATSGASVCSGVGSGGQMWYSYTPAQAGILNISTCGSSMDTYIHVYIGACGTLSCLAQNDDACNLQSSLTISVYAGQTYLIRAGGYASNSGSFTLNVTCGEVTLGCMDPWASNYNPLATAPDSSCVYSGCTDPTAANYDPLATTDDGSCMPWISGCTNPMAENYDPAANTDDGSCVVSGCTDQTAQNFDPYATIDDGSCQYCNGPGSVMANLYICTFSNGNQVELQIVDDSGNQVYYATGLNSGSIINATVCLQPGVCYTANMINNTGPFGWYNGYFWVNSGGVQVINAQPPVNAQFATVQFSIDGTCGPVFGCTDPAAVNYNPDANMEDGTCAYPTTGCMDPLAVNYDSLAMVDDGSCFYMNDCLGSIAQFILHPGVFVNEASYIILNEVGDTIAAGSGESTQYACLLDGCYTIAMYDTFGDGWDAGGYMDIIIDGSYYGTYTLASGLSAGMAYFGINSAGCVPAIPGCTDSQALNYNPLATEDDGSCQYPVECTENLLTIQISTANWGSEIGWNLLDDAGSVVASGSGYSSWGWYTQYACVADGCYELQLTDSWGDGWNGAYYMISTSTNYYEGSLYYGAAASDMIAVNSSCGAVAGCTDADALNYNPQATFNDGSCIYNPGVGPGFTNGLEMEFSIYPNPTNGGMVVNASSIDPLKTVYINIYGLEGQLVRSVNVGSGLNSLQVQQDVSDLPAGYYLVELVNGTSRQVKPLMKQ